MLPESRIYVAGHRGLVGSALVRVLQRKGYKNLVLRTRSELDLGDSAAVTRFFSGEKIDYLFPAAAKVGGIVANINYWPRRVPKAIVCSASRQGWRRLISIPSSRPAIPTNCRTLNCRPAAITKSSGSGCCSISHCIST